MRNATESLRKACQLAIQLIAGEPNVIHANTGILPALTQALKDWEDEYFSSDRDPLDRELEEIARLIIDGNTSGYLDDNEGHSCEWELELNCHTEEDALIEEEEEEDE